LQNVTDPKTKLDVILDLLTQDLPKNEGQFEYNKFMLNQIVINESSKVYLIKDVEAFNKDDVFRPYKELCKKVAEILLECNPNYQYSKSMSSTLIETAHHQHFFATHLPSLTDVADNQSKIYVRLFLNDMIQSVVFH
jgi:hypothetical protein